MSTSPLPISRLINVTGTLTQAAAQAENQQSMIVIGSSPVIDTKTRYRAYPSLLAVSLDFSQGDPEYIGAAAWFSQSPQPPSNPGLLIGRWAKTATAGLLSGAPFSAAQQVTLLAALVAISTGSFTISVDGVALNITGLDFTADANLNAVAATIQAALPAGVTCVWNGNYGLFIITSSTTGAASVVSFATTEGTGVDVSSTLGLKATNSGAYTVAGIVAETALAAVQILDLLAGTSWYGVSLMGGVDADYLAIASYIEADSLLHYHYVNTQAAAVLDPESTTDLGYLLAQGKYQRTGYQYSSSSIAAVISLAARIQTTDYTANNSVITLMWKQEPTIAAEFLNETQINALEKKNGNVFVAYNNNTAIIEPGVSAAGAPYFIDAVQGIDAVVLGVQTALFNALYGAPTKVPQTDPGMHSLATAIEAEMVEFVTDGLLDGSGTAVWLGPPFGSLNTGDTLPKGFYVYAPTVASQPVAQRSQRISVPFQVAAKLSGAVHEVDCAITFN